ncbi:MAG TPA: hypothetical protein VIP70_04960 [Nitrososphaeraceae archaeon]
MNLESKVANNSRSRSSVFLFYNKIYLIPQNKDQHGYLINSEFKISKSNLGNNHFYAFSDYHKNIMADYYDDYDDDKKSCCCYMVYSREEKKEYQG